MATTVRDNPEQSRFEIHVDEELAGFAEYALRPGQIAFTHTEVFEAFGGRGLARELVDGALAEARQRELAVLPFCPYVLRVISRNQEQYLDLVPASERERFNLPAADAETGDGADGTA
ncbi:MAG: N-acetyltransferase [Actinomycetales bacterium]|nr:N-acetyltransferase [Actinomycetales bacterium]